MARRARIHRKSLSPLGSFLNDATLKSRLGAVVTLYRLQKEWKEAVGETLARRTWPSRLNRSVLTVSVENSAWSQHLSLLKDEVMTALKERTGIYLSDLRFVNQPAEVQAKRLAADPAPSEVEDIPQASPPNDEKLSAIMARIQKLMDERQAS